MSFNNMYWRFFFRCNEDRSPSLTDAIGGAEFGVEVVEVLGVAGVPGVDAFLYGAAFAVAFFEGIESASENFGWSAIEAEREL